MSAPRYRWQPTTDEIAAAAGIPPSEVVRFDHNTSPFPTDWATDVVAGPARGLNEYPGASYRPLREAAGRYAEQPADRVAVGAGVDELILLAARAFLGAGGRAVAVTPSYPLYRIATLQAGGALNEIASVGPDLAFPVDAIIEAARDADITWLCVPDNPTGARIADDAIGAIIAATDGTVILDAAYAEFAGDSWGQWTDRHHNLLVLHTLSKAFGVGGIRVGFGLGHPDLIEAIDAVRPPGSIASLSVEVAIAALEDPGRMRRQVAELVTRREVLSSELGRLGFRVLASQTNFLLCEVGPMAGAIGESLMRRGLVVRAFSQNPTLGDYLRITVRTAEQNNRLIEALEKELA